eukprot:6189869-Pleurochrysis_carterae.AAC.1
MMRAKACNTISIALPGNPLKANAALQWYPILLVPPQPASNAAAAAAGVDPLRAPGDGRDETWFPARAGRAHRPRKAAVVSRYEYKRS